MPIEGGWLALECRRAWAAGWAVAAALAAGWGAPSALAQPAPSTALADDVPPLVSHGQGAGVHGAQSPVAPLAPREDVVPWSRLTDIGLVRRERRLLPVYPDAVLALQGRKVRVQGFMMPLEAGQRQRHFLLASVPPNCPFCVPGGPESMVEVQARRGVAYRVDAVVVEGVFHVLQADPSGLYYRLTEAVAVD
jgi:hypothetical protein